MATSFINETQKSLKTLQAIIFVPRFCQKWPSLNFKRSKPNLRCDLCLFWSQKRRFNSLLLINSLHLHHNEIYWFVMRWIRWISYSLKLSLLELVLFMYKQSFILIELEWNMSNFNHLIGNSIFIKKDTKVNSIPSKIHSDLIGLDNGLVALWA